MNTTKTTKRENLTVLETLIADAKNAGFVGYDFDALGAYVANEKTLLDKKTEAAKARAAKQREAGDELREIVFAQLNSDEFTSIADIVKAIDDEAVTSHKVTARLTQLINLHRVEKGEISVTNGDKTRKVNGYRVIAG